MKILDGKKLAEKILKNLRREIKKRRLRLKLAVIAVDRDRVSDSFIRQQQKACQKIGIGFELFELTPLEKNSLTGLSSKKEIENITKDPNNSGVVIVGRKDFSNLIPPEKNVERISPVVCAIERILKEYKISLKQKNVVLVGRGRLVGWPVARWLRKQKIKFSNIDKSSTFQRRIKPRRKNTGVRKVLNKIKKADIIISGVGKPNLIKGGMVKEGVVVIDVGGDVDFKTVSKKASYITPVPGGVGPLVVACLLQNLIKLKK